MRPLELTLRGFRSYREEVTFDLRERHLVGIVGPIGAGKSSVLDAIAFALYGKTPAVERDTRSLIHQLCDEAHVSLRFEVEGEVWRAVRAPRRTGQSGHQLERLASDDADAEPLEKITGDRPVRERVEALLGLDFKAFCRSVLLAQNRFSDFLTATEGDRDAVLKGVFGFERLDRAQAEVRLRLQAAEMALERLQDQQGEVEKARAELEGARARATHADRRMSALEDAKPRDDRLAADAKEARDADAIAGGTIERLQAIAASLPGEDRLEAAAEAAAGARSVVAAAQTQFEESEAARAQRRAEHKDLADRLGDRAKFRSFEALLARHDQEAAAAATAMELAARAEATIAAQREEVVRLESAHVAARAAIETAEEAHATHGRAVEEARTALEAARHGEMARELAGTLSAGEACPVCGQQVATLPRKGPVARKVKAAESALKKAESAAHVAQRSLQEAVAAHAAAQTGAQQAQTTIVDAASEHHRLVTAAQEAQVAHRTTQGQLAEWLGEGDPHALLAERAEELDAAEDAMHRAEEAVEVARKALDRLHADAKDADTAVARFANQLAGAWGQLQEVREVAPDPDAVRASFVALVTTCRERRADAESAREDARARLAAAEDERAALLQALDLTPGEDLTASIARAAAAQGAAAQQVAQLTASIVGADELEREVDAAMRRLEITRRLSQDLRPSQFLAFLLEEERAELALLGSDHFEQLTGGDFRFTDDDRFAIVDRNAAGSERKAESLSGGETFLASLALALALAEMVTRGGGQLDAFFMDEGFGSLDPQHLDLAMDGIGRLVAGDGRRLVVLVSHVAEMREAIEDLIVLDKDPLTGDTVVVSGASPV
jgi:DNA repair protein SbcC/Rad50